MDGKDVSMKRVNIALVPSEADLEGGDNPVSSCKVGVDLHLVSRPDSVDLLVVLSDSTAKITYPNLGSAEEANASAGQSCKCSHGGANHLFWRGPCLVSGCTCADFEASGDIKAGE